MSVLKKVPWIEGKLSKLSGDELSELVEQMNSSAQIGTIYSLYDQNRLIPVSPTETIVNCIIEFERGKHPYTGFLIHNSDMCIFIAYHRYQDLALFEINPVTKTYVRINEECDINELRRLVEEDIGSPKRYFVNNIKAIGDDILNKLKCGDVVVKITHESSRKMHHCYIVSYYEHKHGCCLTYTAAGLVETQSYDYTEGHWVYNSEDIMN